MGKSWIVQPRNTTEYSISLSKFLDFAFENGAVGETIRCPRPKCGFLKWKTRDVVNDHLLWKPFPRNYILWNLHGERQVLEPFRNEDVVQEEIHSESENRMEMLINDVFGHSRQQATNEGLSQPLDADDIPNEGSRQDNNDYYELTKDGNQNLYEGSKCTKLEFLIKLYHIKILCGMSDKAMTLILDFLSEAFEDAKLPSSLYEAKKIIKKLGLEYTKIDA
jgi:hypothetical protein